MNYVKSFLRRNNEEQRDAEIAQIVPLSECSHDCEACTTKFPSSLKFDDGDIYKSSNPIDLHILIPTGKADWTHDISEAKGTLEHELFGWKSHSGAKVVPGGNITISDTSIPINFSDPAYLKGEINDILILPYFVWVKRVSVANVATVLDELVPQLVKSRSEGSKDIPATVKGLDIVKSQAISYVLLCSHTTRDKRCGITAPLMKKEMDFRLRDTGHYRDHGDDRPGGVHVVFVNHVGGHKFAANVIIHNRSGETIWLAKCTPRTCVPIIDETVLGGGKVWGELVRMVQKNKAIQW